MIVYGNLNMNVSDQVKGAAMKALKEAGEVLLEEANRRVPHDTGMLQDSGTPGRAPTALTEEQKADSLSVYCSYNTPYAVRLHEHPEFHFRNGREGKWLENALKDRQSDLIEHVAEAIREALK